MAIRKRVSVDGKACFIALYRDPSGKQRSAGTFVTERQAKIALGDIEKAKFQGTYRRLEPMVFKDFVESWLASKKHTVRISTFTGDEYKIRRHILSALGEFRIADISRAHVDKVRTSVSKMSFSTRKKINHFLATIFKEAFLSHLIAEDPTLTNQKIKNVRPTEYRILTPKEIGKLREVATRKRTGRGLSPSTIELYYLLSILAGLRPEESTAITVDNIDLDKKTIKIAKTVYYFRTDSERGASPKAWVFQDCKTKAAYRTIPMGPDLLKAVQIHLIEAPENPHGLLLATGSGEPLLHNNMNRRYFQRDLKLAGIPKMRFYDLRHTYCSVLVASGERDFMRIKTLMGHAQVTTTLGIYTHLLPGGDLTETVKRMDDYLSQNVNKMSTNQDKLD